MLLLRVNMPDGRCLQVQAFASVVNAHGGLLAAPIKFETNQKTLLINPHSGKEVGCKVVRVEGQTQGMYEVAFELDQRSPRFWPVGFSPEDWPETEETASDNRRTPA